ncbi:MAG: glycosyltransferase [Deltaproteobacteria bacterium]|nr:glycosyltransferase [Deltaproteobacteria bacterium]
MKLLQVIHGYPPHYMAGSEVYTWNLCRQLAKSHEVFVFTRVENPYAKPYEVTGTREDGVEMRRVNKPARDYTFRDKYLDPRMDDAFRAMLRDTNPDVVHFGHLSHLSTQLPAIAKGEFGLPTLLTIHDFWMFCFRGQLLRPEMRLCAGPSTADCYECARHFFKDWIDLRQVQEYRRHMQEVTRQIDVFLAPSRTLESFFTAQGVPADSVIFSPYGFDVERIHLRPKVKSDSPVRFGFMGRIIPAKGIDLLLRAFTATRGAATLNVWGAVDSQRSWLGALCNNDPRVRFNGAYHNGEVNDALKSMDVLVVPSVWSENSPLVIQEALLAEVPVITSHAGGMAELVRDGKNGLLFPLGDKKALSALLQKVIDQPDLLTDLRPQRGSVRTIHEDAASIERIYMRLLRDRERPILPLRPAPRRVTFVTNPGLCNLHCRMCDTHSHFSTDSPAALPLLDFALVERTVVELTQRGLQEIIPSTMGEPLLYPQFSQMLELAARTDVKVNLTTNGTFPQKGVEAWAAEILPVASDVKFSINGFDPQTAEAIMKGLRPVRQLEDVAHYMALKRRYEQKTGRVSTATLQVTFMEDNLDQLPKLLLWAIEHRMDRFKGHHLWVTWPELPEQSLRRSRESATRWNRVVDALHRIAAKETLPNDRRIVLANVDSLSPETTLPDSGTTRCPFLGREAWIDADGSFQVCCCPSKERAAFGKFGNLLERSFMDIWTSERYRKFVAGWGSHPNCRICNMRQPLEVTT